MLDTIEESQFQEWQAFNAIDPLGSQRLETIITNAALAVCQLLRLLVKSWGGDVQEFRPEQFDPWLKPHVASVEENPQASSAALRANLEMALDLARKSNGFA